MQWQINGDKIMIAQLGNEYFRLVKMNPWISKRQAGQLIGRSRFKRMVDTGYIQLYKRNPDNRLGRVMVNFDDLMKIKDKPI